MWRGWQARHNNIGFKEKVKGKWEDARPVDWEAVSAVKKEKGGKKHG